MLHQNPSGLLYCSRWLFINPPITTVIHCMQHSGRSHIQKRSLTIKFGITRKLNIQTFTSVWSEWPLMGITIVVKIYIGLLWLTISWYWQGFPGAGQARLPGKLRPSQLTCVSSRLSRKFELYGLLWKQKLNWLSRVYNPLTSSQKHTFRQLFFNKLWTVVNPQPLELLT